MNKSVMAQIGQEKLLPVAVIQKLEDTSKLLDAITAGGLNVIEITFRTQCAPEAIKFSAKNYPQVLTGAGTVVNADQAQEAIDCGAKFIVGPGFSPEVAKICLQNSTPYFPGCVTPTEIMEALEYGIDIVKFFPAQEFGGLKAIKALSSALKDVKFIPTGGINNDNLIDYIQHEKIFACGGSWLLKGSYEQITQNIKSAIKIVNGGK
jgi:2-dehydro-3-deoxyphosphogluconate aldolase/(4S)-4-hydroxy-2-oxoglutarate aldolase